MSERREIEPKEAVAVEIPEDILQRIEELPGSVSGQRRYPFTEEQDAVILRYWKTKRKPDLCKILAEMGVDKNRKSLHENTVRKRYQELTST